MTALSRPHEGRDINRNGWASALYLSRSRSRPLCPPLACGDGYSAAVAGVVCETAKRSIKLIQIKQHTLGAE
jgi:hypothetical protein